MSTVGVRKAPDSDSASLKALNEPLFDFVYHDIEFKYGYQKQEVISGLLLLHTTNEIFSFLDAYDTKYLTSKCKINSLGRDELVELIEMIRMKAISTVNTSIQGLEVYNEFINLSDEEKRELLNSNQISTTSNSHIIAQNNKSEVS